MVALGMTAMPGCFGDDDEDKGPTCPTQSKLIGTWEMTRATVVGGGETYEFGPEDLGEITYTFNEGGTGVETTDEGTESAQWSVDCNKLTLTYADESTETVTFNVTDTELTISFQEEEEGVTFNVTMYFTKQ